MCGRKVARYRSEYGCRNRNYAVIGIHRCRRTKSISVNNTRTIFRFTNLRDDGLVHNVIDDLCFERPSDTIHTSDRLQHGWLLVKALRKRQSELPKKVGHYLLQLPGWQQLGPLPATNVLLTRKTGARRCSVVIADVEVAILLQHRQDVGFVSSREFPIQCILTDSC